MENKEQVAWHSPEEIDEAEQRAQNDIFAMYEPTYGTDSISKSALDPFVNEYQVTGGNSVGGLITLPPDFRKALGFYVTSFDNTYGTQFSNVDIVNNDEFANRAMEAQLIPINAAHPICRVSVNGTLQLEPRQPNTGILTYLRSPKVPFTKYTLVGRVITYDDANSVNLEWNETFITKILSKTLIYLSINIEEAFLMQAMGQNMGA